MTLQSAYYALGSLAARVQRRRPVGRSIFSADWDICIILDSARVDMLREAWPRDDEISSVWSRGSITTEWLANTFRQSQRRNVARTAHVTASPHSQTVFRDRQYLTNADDVSIRYPDPPVVSPNTFAAFYELWRSHATIENAVPPDVMADATLEAYERHGKVVAHWLQPHEPFIAPGATLVGGGATATNVWRGLRNGTLDSDDVWQSYQANLEYALRHVQTVVENADASVLITADHGNAFGEWGVYGHPYAWPQPEVRKVPWLQTQARDIGDHTPEPILDSEATSETVAEQLKALGYR